MCVVRATLHGTGAGFTSRFDLEYSGSAEMSEAATLGLAQMQRVREACRVHSSQGSSEWQPVRGERACA